MLPAGIRFEIDRLRLENTRGKASYSCDAISTALSRTQRGRNPNSHIELEIAIDETATDELPRRFRWGEWFH